jgi:hypothetical protein
MISRLFRFQEKSQFPKLAQNAVKGSPKRADAGVALPMNEESMKQ